MTKRQISLKIREIRKSLIGVRKEFIKTQTIDKAEFVKKLNTIKGEVDALICDVSTNEEKIEEGEKIIEE